MHVPHCERGDNFWQLVLSCHHEDSMHHSSHQFWWHISWFFYTLSQLSSLTKYLNSIWLSTSSLLMLTRTFMPPQEALNQTVNIVSQYDPTETLIQVQQAKGKKKAAGHSGLCSLFHHRAEKAGKPLHSRPAQSTLSQKQSKKNENVVTHLSTIWCQFLALLDLQISSVYEQLHGVHSNLRDFSNFLCC